MTVTEKLTFGRDPDLERMLKSMEVKPRATQAPKYHPETDYDIVKYHFHG